jgi:hypothetical protein
VYASQEGRTNALPLIVYMDWTAKAALALHSGSALVILGSLA